MSRSKVTIRYAKALLQLAIKEDILADSYKDMILLDTVCAENKELLLMLKSPIIKTDKKLKILEDIFGSKINPVSMLFVNIITKKKRENLLPLIATSFIALYKDHKKIESATVISATPLEESLRNEVINFIQKHSDKNVELKQKVDPAIIGGSIINMGDKQLDTSVSKAISELRKIFNKNLYLQDF